jgi:hypothetical protein
MSANGRAPLSIPASADLSASEFCGVISGVNGLALPAAGGSIIGVLYSKPNAIGKPGLVRSTPGDRLEIKAGGTIARGDDLKVQADGTFITCVAGDVAAGKRVGICWDAATVGNRGSMIFLGAAGATVSTSGQEIVATGALGAAFATSYLNIVGTKAYVLPDGLFVGQQHIVEVQTATTTPIGTLTVTTPYTGEAATHILKAVKQRLTFVWMFDGAVTGWHLLAKQRGGKSTYIVATDSFVGNSDKSIDLSIAGTKTGALPNGGAVGEVIVISISSATATPVGNLTGLYRTKFGVAATNLTGLDATTDFAVLEWDGAAWCELNSTGVTFA